MNKLALERVVPEARQIVQAAAEVYLRHTEQWCIGLLIHGSALKGGFIPGCSDVDLQLYLQPEAFTAYGQLPLEICCTIQRDLASIDPRPFQYIQGYALPPIVRPGYIAAIPGTYHMLTGTLPVPEASEEDLQRSARTALTGMDRLISNYCRGLLDHGAGKLERQVRFLCTDVGPTLCHILTIQEQNGIHVWSLPKPEVIALLPQESPLALRTRAFYQLLQTYYSLENSLENAIRVIEAGIAFFEEVKIWQTENVR